MNSLHEIVHISQSYESLRKLYSLVTSALVVDLALFVVDRIQYDDFSVTFLQYGQYRGLFQGIHIACTWGGHSLALFHFTVLQKCREVK